MADEEIQRSTTKRQIARLIGNASIPMYILGEGDQILFANDALATFVGIELDQLTGMDCSKRIQESESRNSLIAAALALPPSTDRALTHWLPFEFDQRVGGMVRICFPIEDSESPMVFCAIKPDRGDRDSLADGAHRARLQRILASFGHDPNVNSDLWFLVGTSPEVLRTRKQIQSASQSRLGVHVIGPASSSSLAVAKWIAHKRLASQHATAPSIVPSIVVECRLMDSDLLRGIFEMIDEQARVGNKSGGLSHVILHQLDYLPAELVDSLCQWLTRHRYPLLATSAAAELIQTHAKHDAWGELVANIDSHLVHVTGLAQRVADIEPMVATWLERSGTHRSAYSKIRWNHEFMDTMRAYSWPGDMHEFDQVMRSAVDRCQENILTSEHLPIEMRTFPSHMRRPEAVAKLELDLTLEQVERELIQRALTSFPRNRTAAASHLGISRARLLRRLQQLGLATAEPSKRDESEEPIFEELHDGTHDHSSESSGE
jgi:transcriptional regulator with AAA-type ATPase domain